MMQSVDENMLLRPLAEAEGPLGPATNFDPAVNTPLLFVFHWLKPEQRAGLLVGQQVQ
jgi:hypothetical protein